MGFLVMKYACFLDIDGVLTSNRAQFANPGMWTRFDPVAIEYLNSLHFKYDITFVVTSSWKDFLPMNDTRIFLWVESAFRSSGFGGKIDYKNWKTDDLKHLISGSDYRAKEIRDFVTRHEIEDYIIFDDSDFEYDEILGRKRFIKTDSDDGMLFRHMLEADQIVREWSQR